jgi:membrane fusion protein (multidrug efflux system)
MKEIVLTMPVAKKLFVMGVLIAILAVFGWVVYYKATQKAHIVPPNPTISASYVKEQETQANIVAVGTLKAYQGVNLTAKDSAVVTRVFFSSDASVNTGDIIIEQETDIQLAILNQAKAELTLAKANYDRASRLIKKGYISQQDYEETKEKYLYAQATYKKAQAELNDRIIIAPFSGTLGLMTVQVGDYITQGQDLVTLTNLDKLYVDFFVAEPYIDRIKKGDPIQITSAINAKKTVIAKVSVLESVINDQTYMLKVRAFIDNQDHFLKPGGFANIQVYFGDKKNVLTVPQTAIAYSNKGNYVYKLVDNVAQKVMVTLGPQVGDSIIIQSGLNKGDRVVSAGINKVHDGQRVNLSNQTLT